MKSGAITVGAGEHGSVLVQLQSIRQRLQFCMLFLLCVLLGLMAFSNQIYTFVAQPIQAQLPQGASMIATEVTSTFFAPFKLTVLVAFFVSLPVMLYHLCRSCMPTSTPGSGAVWWTVVLGAVLFYSGVAFSYFVAFPAVMGFFAMIQIEGVMIAPDINSYLGIAMKLFFAFGMAFEIPLLIVFLVRVGVVSLASIRHRRAHAIVVCFVVAMLLTPPDVISQSLLAIPMWLLFELGVVLASVSSRRNLEQDKDVEAVERGKQSVDLE